MSSTAEDLANAIAVVAALDIPAVHELSDADAVAWLQSVEQLGRHADTLRVRAAGDIAERSRRELGSASLARRFASQSAAALIEKLTRVSGREASRRIRLAHEIAPRVSLTGLPLPARYDRVASAMDAGDLGLDAALTIVRNLSSAERTASVEQLNAAEHDLVEEAKILSADLVGVQARAWRSALDPDGAEPRDRELREQRSLVFGREIDGMVPFHGLADPVSASQLKTWTSIRMAPDAGPRFLDPDEALTEEGRDPRTREQRTFDILMGLLLAGVRADSQVTTAKHGAANVMVVVRDSVLETGRGQAWISDIDEPISASSAATLACDSGIQNIFLGAQGEVLAMGRRERFHTAAMRKAMAVRDGGGCSFPGCTAPPSWTQAHHPEFWSDDGETSVDNGVLLCAFHHRLIHEGEWQILMRDGIPYIRAPKRLDVAQRWIRMGRHRPAVAA